MFEIIFAVLAGIFPIIVSVWAIHKSNKQEEETLKYQNQSIDLQKKLNEKTDEIIDLNKQLKNQADSHAVELKKMTKPIPKKVYANFLTDIVIEDIELEPIINYYAGEGKDQTNLISKSLYNNLPFNSSTIELLFQSNFHSIITIRGDGGKNINLTFSQHPISISEDILETSNGKFIIGFNSETKKVCANCWFDLSKKCTSNSHTLFDFQNFEIDVTFQFFLPQRLNNRMVMAMDNENRIKLKLISTDFYFDDLGGFHMNIDNYIEQMTNSFSSKGKIDIS